MSSLAQQQFRAASPPRDLERSTARLSRRAWLAQAAAGSLAAGGVASGLPGLGRVIADPAPTARPKVAAIITEFTYRSHAHVILENFLVPYLFNGQWVDPGMDVVSMYLDQVPAGDMSREVSRQFSIPIFPTIGQALTRGGDALAVDGVISIGEHGQYPTNAKGQMEYPRKRFFDEIVAVFERSGRSVPVFNDKHLSYRWDWALEMVETARRLQFPFLAGSSVPLAERRPPLELPAEARVEAAVSIHGGGVESYDFHCLEVLQSFIEARRGGESGVREVQFLEGEALWQAAAEGRWSVELAEAAMRAELGPDLPPLRELAASERIGSSPPHGVLVSYRDGLSAIALKLGASATRWNFACRLAGETEPRATAIYVGPWQNRNLFRALSHAIQGLIRERQAPYPVERTLLVSGILDQAMESRLGGGQPRATPELQWNYAPVDFRRWRELGATWKIITDDTPEPAGIERVPAA